MQAGGYLPQYEDEAQEAAAAAGEQSVSLASRRHPDLRARRPATASPSAPGTRRGDALEPS